MLPWFTYRRKIIPTVTSEVFPYGCKADTEYTLSSIAVLRLCGKQEMQGSIPCEGIYPFVPSIHFLIPFEYSKIPRSLSLDLLSSSKEICSTGWRISNWVGHRVDTVLLNKTPCFFIYKRIECKTRNFKIYLILLRMIEHLISLQIMIKTYFSFPTERKILLLRLFSYYVLN